MLTRLASSVVGYQKTPAPQPASEKGVVELLAALEEVRTKKAELEQREKEILAATRTRLREQQEALEELKKRVQDCGITIEGERPTPAGNCSEPAPSQPSATSLTNN